MKLSFYNLSPTNFHNKNRGFNEVEVQDNITVEAFLKTQKLEINNTFVVIVNKKRVDIDFILSDNDVVQCVPLIGGG